MQCTCDHPITQSFIYNILLKSPMDKQLHITRNWLGESSSRGMCNHSQFSINLPLLQLLQSYLKGLHIPPLEDSPNQFLQMCNRLSIGLYRRILYIKLYVKGWSLLLPKLVFHPTYKSNSQSDLTQLETLIICCFIGKVINITTLVLRLNDYEMTKLSVICVFVYLFANVLLVVALK